MVALSGVISGALAASYPDRPVRLIVPSPAGGGIDTTMRMIAPKLAEYLGQQIPHHFPRDGVDPFEHRGDERHRCDQAGI
jgi:hypothetical protein